VEVKTTVKVISVVGARPNFMKIAPIVAELERHRSRGLPIENLLVHTGQHYDEELSAVFFNDLGLPQPDIYLGVGSGTHAEQTGKVMIEFERVCLQKRPDLVIVVGDVNSTLACALVAAKQCTLLAHVEAGLRSFDRTMPEEINRMLTDHLADFLFTHSEEANENLRREGIEESRIYFVGNVMIDTLLRHKARAEASQIRAKFGLVGREYGLLTLHRPSNVDYEITFRSILNAIAVLQNRIPVVFPIHPRTRKKIAEFGLQELLEQMVNLIVTDPLGYLDFLHLMSHAKLVLTDSGGIQEETTVLGVPCLTLRENTERMITVKKGTNVVVGTETDRIIEECFKILDGATRESCPPPLWDGKAAYRLVNVILDRFGLNEDTKGAWLT